MDPPPPCLFCWNERIQNSQGEMDVPRLSPNCKQATRTESQFLHLENNSIPCFAVAVHGHLRSQVLVEWDPQYLWLLFLKPCGPKDWTKALAHAGQALYHWVMALAVMALHLPWGKQENQGQCDVKKGQRSRGVWGAAEGFQNLVREYGYRSWPLTTLPRGNSSAIGRQELWIHSFGSTNLLTASQGSSQVIHPCAMVFLFVFCCFEKNQQIQFFLLSIWIAWSIPPYPQ